MQNKFLNEDEAAVGSVDGSKSKISENSERSEDNSGSQTELNLNVAPFNISKLRDHRGKLFKVVFRDTGNNVQIEIHNEITTLNNIDDIINYRICETKLIADISSLSKEQVRAKWVNAGMRCLCHIQNKNQTLSEIEKFLQTPVLVDLINL